MQPPLIAQPASPFPRLLVLSETGMSRGASRPGRVYRPNVEIPPSGGDDGLSTRTTIRIDPGDEVHPSSPPSWMSDAIPAIGRDDAAHVGALAGLLGASARPRPRFCKLAAPNVRVFAAIAQAVKTTSVELYQAVLVSLSRRDLFAPVSSIALAEGHHCGLLNAYRGANLVDGGASFVVAASLEEAVAVMGPFLDSLEGGPPLAFATIPSEENDLDALNCLLALEYLQEELFSLNVPWFFP